MCRFCFVAPEEGGGRLTGSPENGYWLVGEGDREEPDFLAAKRLTASQLYNDLADNYHPDDENLNVAFSPPRLGRHAPLVLTKHLLVVHLAFTSFLSCCPLLSLLAHMIVTNARG